MKAIPSAISLVTTGPSIWMYFGMFFVPVAAIAPMTSAPQWMRTDEFRTETSRRPSFTASMASGIASTLPSLMSRPAFLTTLDAARPMSSLWKNPASILGNFTR
jgi:hypothetical protein